MRAERSRVLAERDALELVNLLHEHVRTGRLEPIDDQIRSQMADWIVYGEHEETKNRGA